MNRSWNRLSELSITSIHPEGWLRRFLELQRDGLTGHLEVAGFPFDTCGWAGARIPHRLGEPWWPYEQTAYWIDGLIRCGHALNEPALVNKGKHHLEYVLDHQDSDGFLGPRFIRRDQGRWHQAVLFRAFMAHHSATGDQRYVEAMTRHFLNGTSPHSTHRDAANIEAILWTYHQTGEKKLLSHALNAFREYNQRHRAADTSLDGLTSPRRATEHGVSYCELGKLGAIVYLSTGNEEFLDASIHGFEKLDRDQMLVDGVPSSSEHLQGKDPLDSHETCVITDYSWSCGYLLMASGDSRWADRIERACLNGAMGAVKSDFKAIQYFSSPNQVIAASNSNHNPYKRGGAWMSYRPNPGTECCAGNVHRIMPNYVSRMWMRSGNSDLAAVLYGPCRITTTVGKPSTEITLVEETDYPFSERIDFTIRTHRPVTFGLLFRIPGWCTSPAILVNGQPFKATLVPGSFFALRRTFNQNDRITLYLPMQTRSALWTGEGISIERGPLAYALRIEEEWKRVSDKKSTNDFPAWDLFAASPWNYALDLSRSEIEGLAPVFHPNSPEPWSIDTAPVELRVPARKVARWDISRAKHTIVDRGDRQERISGTFAFTPPLPDSTSLKRRLSRRSELVRLIPYGCTHLRLTVFPNAGEARYNRSPA